MRQCPQETWKGTTTRSPGFREVTADPTSSTTPMGSWPRMSPGFMNGPRTSYRCRSEPHSPELVTRMTASSGSSARGSGTVSVRTSRTPFHTTAFIVPLLPRPVRWPLSGGWSRDCTNGRFLAGHCPHPGPSPTFVRINLIHHRSHVRWWSSHVAAGGRLLAGGGPQEESVDDAGRHRPVFLEHPRQPRHDRGTGQRPGGDPRRPAPPPTVEGRRPT